ncbi:trypsin-2-like isoform X2 [Daktulosphaira vitifoliae]|uniref:trypsin-2-like isoform X2 n=1 Tax=Daktulosphaira vitifoliae TaxID=58002 RepID=UPI0021AA1A25|nr:trypsin-2-like isoform X2 [Daktulosphaira vitifoliae]
MHAYLCLLGILAIVGFQNSTGQLVRVKLERDIERRVETCGPEAECVSSIQSCDVTSESSSTLKKCHYIQDSRVEGVCCPVKNIVLNNRKKRQANNNAIESDLSELDQALDRSSPEPIKPMPEDPNCGINSKTTSNIVNAQVTSPSEWPWMAVLLENTNYINFCGGVIINKRFVLTAAHCFKTYKQKEIVIRVGEYDFTKKNETQYTDYRPAAIRIHPDYDTATHANDIALIRLNRPLTFSTYVQPICLPKTNMQIYNKTAVVCGWGQTAFDEEISNVLLEVAVPVWDHEECVLAFSQPIFRTNICAAEYEGGKDSCLGDSGGPLLMQRSDGRWTNIGVVSWGINCAQPGFPGVYAKTTSFLKWIAVNTQDIN